MFDDLGDMAHDKIVLEGQRDDCLDRIAELEAENQRLREALTAHSGKDTNEMRGLVCSEQNCRHSSCRTWRLTILALERTDPGKEA